MEPLSVALGFTPYFAARPLLATFVVAVAYASGAVAFDRSRDLTFGEAVFVVVGFGLLAVAEAVWKRVAAWLRELADSASRWIRRGEASLSAVTAVLVASFLLGGFDAVMQAAPAGDVREASLGTGTTTLLLAGVFVLTYAFAWTRAYVVDTLDVLVPSELGVSRVVGFVEVFCTTAGVVLALLLPTLAIALAAAVAVGAIGVVLTLRSLSRGERSLCASCSGDVHASASRCGRCGAARPAPRRYGVLGPARDAAPDTESHRFALLALRRCPHCAESLVGIGMDSRCERCTRPAFATDDELRDLVRRVDGRVLRLLPLAALFGLVPGAGLGIGLSVFKLSAANALAGYVPWQGRLWTRILRSALLFVAGLVQLVPFVGAVVVPVTIGAMHLSSRSAIATRESEVIPVPASPRP